MASKEYLICPECLNERFFFRVVYGTCRFEGKEQYDSQKNEYEIEDRETTDEDTSDFDSWSCEECDFDKIMEFDTEKEMAEEKYKHIKDGLWFPDELPENERDPELGKQLMVNNL